MKRKRTVHASSSSRVILGRPAIGLIAALCITVMSSVPVKAQTLMGDDFEAYAAGSWPAPWVADAAAHNQPPCGVYQDPQVSTNQAFRLHGSLGGCWAALAYHPCTFPDRFSISARIYNGTENLTGCHQLRGCIYQRVGTSWGQPSRCLLRFMEDGTVQGVNEIPLPATYVPGRWYDVRVAFQVSGSNVTADYWLDNAHIGTIQAAQAPYDFTHFEFNVQEGTAWLDEVIVFADDCNGNGIPDGQDLSGGTSADCNQNGVPDECDIADNPGLDLNGNGVIDACECSARNYCLSAANSVGTNAVIGSNGQVSVSGNNFELNVGGVVPLQFGMFFYSERQQAVFYGEGMLCVGPRVQRIFPLLVTDGNGAANLPLDFTQPPFSAGEFAILANSTMNFQFWYRDPLGGPSGFNFSDGLEVTFCP